MFLSNLKIKLEALVVTLVKVQKFIEFLKRSVKTILIIGQGIGTLRLGEKLPGISWLDMNVEADMEILVDFLGILVLIDIIGAIGLRVNFYLRVINVTTGSRQHLLCSCLAARCFTCNMKSHTGIDCARNGSEDLRRQDRNRYCFDRSNNSESDRNID